jgi:anti-anti-sigma factor
MPGGSLDSLGAWPGAPGLRPGREVAAPDPFEIRRAGTPRSPVLFLRGELDFFSVEQLRAALEGLPSGAREVMVDLRNLSYIDSSGTWTLIRASRAMAQQGATLVCIARRDGSARRVLDLVAGDRLDVREAPHRPPPGPRGPAG